MNADVLEQLAAILEQRKGADPSTSYVAKLYAGGLDLVRKKIGEEATEVVIAAGHDDDTALIHEVADLWFHTLVALAASMTIYNYDGGPFKQKTVSPELFK